MITMLWTTGARGPWSPSPQVRMALPGLLFSAPFVGFSGHQRLVLGMCPRGAQAGWLGLMDSDPLDLLTPLGNWNNSPCPRQSLSPWERGCRLEGHVGVRGQDPTPGAGGAVTDVGRWGPSVGEKGTSHCLWKLRTAL